MKERLGLCILMSVFCLASVHATNASPSLCPRSWMPGSRWSSRLPSRSSRAQIHHRADASPGHPFQRAVLL